MEVSLSIAELFIKTFGEAPPAFNPQFDAVKGDTSKNRTLTGSIAGSDYYDVDSEGREYYLPIQFLFGNDPIPGSSSTTYKEAFGMDYWMLPYPIFSVEARKRVVDTELTQRNGLVSELINLSGYKLNVRGFLVNHTENAFPEADFMTLIKLYELNAPLTIQNPITDILFIKSGTMGTNQVTIRNLRMPEARGIKNVRPYELELVQEVPFNLVQV